MGRWGSQCVCVLGQACKSVCVCVHVCSEMCSGTWPPVSVLGGAAGLGVCVCMHICTAVSVSFFPNSLKYPEALCLTILKSFSHLFSQRSEDYHFSTIALFGSKTKSSSISRHVLISTSLHNSRCILGT